ncbi:MAG TPA: aspartate carbamoyltransferase catalytic subunit [Alphaproteobacteria bacterium]|nr:aspartate carbamoyltransferase catalytic subunit [Alphaproteobacteria bacterium]
MASSFPHRHLIDIERLSAAEIESILTLAKQYAEQSRAPQKKINKLNGKTVVNLFFEPSTRTRTSFEIAAKRLGADVVNIPVEHSSSKKGETLLDTVLNLDAMQIDALVIRHSEDGIPQFVAPHMKSASVINAGDGKHEHPTQALLDAFTMLRHKKSLKGLVVAICGDIAHSRVARSNAHLLTKLGAKVRFIAPSYFAAPNFTNLGIETFEDMKEGLKDADVVMMLRIQHERMAEGEFAVSLKDYHQRFGLDAKKLAVAKPDVIVMHPGPINRDVEIASSLADDPKYSVLLEQTEMGVAIRMAVLDLLLSK